MPKVKIKCASCGKSFKSPDAKRTLCPECQAARKAQAARVAPPPTPVTAPRPAVDVRAAFLAAQRAAGEYAAYRAAPVETPPPSPAPSPAPVPERAASPSPVPLGAARTITPAGTGPRAGGPRARSGEAPRPPQPSHPPHQRKEPTPPFVPSDEQVEAIRQRYLELAQPEYDGIRHQIAHELAVPIRVVKDVVKELRGQMSLPSWWELASASLTDEQRSAVRALYLPQLPLPDVGIHKRIAEQLGVASLAVYSTIRTLREELGLPRYNDRPDRGPAAGAPAGSEGVSPFASSEAVMGDGADRDSLTGEQALPADGGGPAADAGPSTSVLAAGDPERPFSVA